MEPFKWFWTYVRKYRFHYAAGLTVSVVVISLALVNPYIAGLLVKEVFENGNKDALVPFLLLMCGATLLKTTLRYSCQMVYENVSQSVVYNLRQDIYKRIQDQSFHFFDSNRVGDIMSRMTGDMDAIRHFLSHVIYSLFENVLAFFGAIILMFAISWKITLLMLCVAPVVAWYTFRQAKEIKPAFSAIREQFSRLNSTCQENISGNRIVKAFTREDYEIEKFTKENEAYYDENIKSADIWIKYLPKQEFMAGVLNVIMILVGGIMVIRGEIQVYQLVTINGYLWAVNNPMRMIGWLINDLQRYVASLDKIFGMMNKGIKVENKENPVTVDKIKGAVEFDNVTFTYDTHNKNAVALKNISFKAEPGQTVGIVGPTGSGKTTLVNLICRFYDATEGAVRVDNVDVKDYDLQCLRRDISSAMQDVFLFSDTVEGNIAYGVPEAPMETVIESAKTADADAFIGKLSEGYDTIIGERGVGLSGGQRQRLSLARAVAANPSILILDDTTSAVDMETEHEIQLALNKGYADRTKFIIAHRISSVKPADLILVLVDGEVLERGTHDELVAMKGYYYGLFINQYGDYAEKGAV